MKNELVQVSLEKRLLLIHIAELLKEKEILESKITECVTSRQLLKNHPKDYFEIQRTLKKLNKITNP